MSGETLRLKQDQIREFFTQRVTTSTSIEEAREILGNDFAGSEVLKTVFNISLNPLEIPPIPFSKPELQRAKKLGLFLILRTDKTPDGQPLTMQKMVQLINVSWHDGYEKKDFFTKDTPKPGWYLVSKDVIPGSTDKHFLYQTQVIADYLRNQFFTDIPMPLVYHDAIKDFDKQKWNIAKNPGWNDQEKAKRLADLKLNQLTRHTPTEALYDIFVQYYGNQNYVIKTFTMTLHYLNDWWNYGNFLSIRGEKKRVRVHDCTPYYSNSGIGVCLSLHL